MVPVFLPLVFLLAGILSGPYVDARAVWLCIPLTIVLAIARRPFILLLVFFGGVVRRDAIPQVPPDPESGPVRLTGTLAGPPKWRGIGVYLDVDIRSIDGRTCRGRARLTEFLDEPEPLKIFEALHLGSSDTVEILVALHRPATYRDPGVFDYRLYLERQGIYWTGTIRNPRLITVLHSGWHGSDRLRAWVQNRIARNFDDGTIRGLVLGMVMGSTSGLPASTERQFQEAGLFHIVVVSGFNIAVIGGAATWLGRFLTRRRGLRLVLTCLAIVAYTGLVGWQTPAVRAAIMGCTFLAGRALDRGHSSLNAIAQAAFVLLLADPLSVLDASFQMTFAAVVAVVGVGIPATEWILEKWNLRLHQFGNVDRDAALPPEIADWRVKNRMWCEERRLPHSVITLPRRVIQILGETLIATLGVEAVFVFFMVESFHRLAWISPEINVPAGVITAAITPLGLSLILLPRLLAIPVAAIVSMLVRILLWLVRSGLTIPYSSVRVPSAPTAVWVIYGVFLGLVVLAIRRRWRYLSLTATAACVVVLTFIALRDFSPPPPDNVVVTFLDVGQGDSILLEFPDGRRMLIDGGGVSAGRFLGLRDERNFSIGEDVVSTYLFSRGIRRLDTVVLTHAHYDHLDGLFDVVSNFEIGEVWLGRNPLVPTYQAFMGHLRDRRIPVRKVSAGDRIREFTILHPSANYPLRKTAQNNDSVVLLLSAGKQTALFTGDLEMAIPAPAFVNLLKVPHHGSGGVKLKVASQVRVISVGANNPFGHPSKAALPALRTDQLGAIRVTLSGRIPVVAGFATSSGEFR